MIWTGRQLAWVLMTLWAVAWTGCERGVEGESAASSKPAAGPDPQWLLFRGDAQLRGVAEGKLAAAPALKWTFKTGGPIQSSAVIAGGKAFIGSLDEKVYALDLKTGAKSWEYKTGDGIEAPPTIIGDKLLVGSLDSWLYCLDAAGGMLKWKYETGDKITGAANLATGKEGQALVVVGSHDSNLHGVKLSDGTGVWKYAADNYINGAPAISQGRTAFGGCDEVLHIVLTADGTGVAKVEIGAPIAASAAMYGPFAYFMHQGGGFLAVDMAEGRIAWQSQAKGQPQQSPVGSPAVTEEVVVYGAGKKLLCVKRSNGEAIWTFPARKSIDSSPVICDGKVVFGSDDGRLYLVDLADGKELWNYEIGQPISGSAAVAGGWIVIGGMDGVVYAFQ